MTIITIPAVFPDGETYGGEEVRVEVVTGTQRPAHDGDRHIMGVLSYRMPTDDALAMDLLANPAGTVTRVSVEEYRWWIAVPASGGPYDISDPTIGAESLPSGTTWEQGPPGEQGETGPVGPTGANIGEATIGVDVAPGVPVHLDAYGPDPTGGTDSNAAFAAAFAAVWASRIATDPAGTGTGVLRAGLHIGPGTFVITEPEVLFGLGGAGTQKASGLVIRGSGINNTQIIYDPGAGDEAGPVMRNNDQFLNVTFEDIEFASTAAEADPVKPVFFHSDASGGAKDIDFHRCRWTGWWDKVIKLTGDNTNAQWSFRACRGRDFGAANGFLWADPADSAAPFVNYWFEHCTFALKGGHFVNGEGYLGHIHMRDSMVLYDTTATDGTLFRVLKDNVGSNESTLIVDGCYFELHNDGQMLLESHWQRGNILFRGSNWNSGGPGDFVDSTSVSVKVYNDNKGWPTVVFDQCGIKGIQQYHYNNTSFQGPANRIRYMNCEYRGFVRMAELFAFVDGGTTSKLGGLPAIEVKNCTQWTGAGANYQAINDQTINWQSSMSAQPTSYLVPFRSGDGEMLRSVDGATVALKRLPVGAVLRSAVLHVLSGGSSSTSWSFVFTDADALAVATFAGGGTVTLANTRYLRVDNINLVLSTTNKATITCVVTGTVPSGVVGYLALEYLG